MIKKPTQILKSLTNYQRETLSVGLGMFASTAVVLGFILFSATFGEHGIINIGTLFILLSLICAWGADSFSKVAEV